MRWQVVSSILLLSCVIQLHATEAELKPHLLKSGAVIYPKSQGEVSIPASPNGKSYFIGYRTNKELSDSKTCLSEAMEYWEELRPTVEKVKGVTLVVIQPERPVPGLSGESVLGFRQFKVHRNSDGSWAWDSNTSAAPVQN